MPAHQKKGQGGREKVGGCGGDTRFTPPHPPDAQFSSGKVNLTHFPAQTSVLEKIFLSRRQTHPRSLRFAHRLHELVKLGVVRIQMQGGFDDQKRVIGPVDRQEQVGVAEDGFR